MDLATLSLADFQPLITQEFKLENSQVALKLLETKPLTTHEGASRTAFSLLFACPVPASQGTYVLWHDSLGRLEIFLVPIKQDGTGVQLEAVFS
jgi:hypothetical protein